MPAHSLLYRGDRGMATAEFGAGVVCTTAIAAALLALVDAGWFTDQLERVFELSFTGTLADLVGPLW